jgi:membrane protein
LFVGSLLANAGVVAISNRLRGIIPDTLPLWSMLNFAVAFAVITLLTGIIYHVLPDVTIHWRDVWAGAAFVAALFVPGQYLIGVYFARAGIGSAYGAAGSIIILLVWIYLSMQIFLLGAEFSQVFARSHGRAILPDEHAVQLLRQTLAEHQAELDEIEREFDQQLEVLKLEAQTMTERAESGKPSLPPRPLAGRIATIAAPIVSLITGVVLGIIGAKQQIGKKRRKFL